MLWILQVHALLRTFKLISQLIYLPDTTLPRIRRLHCRICIHRVRHCSIIHRSKRWLLIRLLRKDGHLDLDVSGLSMISSLVLIYQPVVDEWVVTAYTYRLYDYLPPTFLKLFIFATLNFVTNLRTIPDEC